MKDPRRKPQLGQIEVNMSSPSMNMHTSRTSSRCWSEVEVLENDFFDMLEVLFLDGMKGMRLWSIVPGVEANW